MQLNLITKCFSPVLSIEKFINLSGKKETCNVNIVFKQENKNLYIKNLCDNY